MKQEQICPNFGDVFFANLTEDGHVQGGFRPVVIAQNNVGNFHSPTVGIIPLSSQVEKAKHLPTHVVIPADIKNGLRKDSVALAEQTRIINKCQLDRYLGTLKHIDLVKIGRAMSVQFPFPSI